MALEHCGVLHAIVLALVLCGRGVKTRSDLYRNNVFCNGILRQRYTPVISPGVLASVYTAHWFNKGCKKAQLETYISDFNARLDRDRNVTRLLLVSELTDAFGRSFGMDRTKDGSKVYVANSDKISLPESVFKAINTFGIEVPWQFLLQKVHEVPEAQIAHKNGNKPRVADYTFSAGSSFLATIQTTEENHKERLACSSLDFRALENFCFLPRWMMEDMGIKPFDMVMITYQKFPEATTVKLLPLDDSFFKLDNQKMVLEQHLKHYGTLTRGATISITHKNKSYNLRILSIDTVDFKNVECASIQDTDVAVNIVTSTM